MDRKRFVDSTDLVKFVCREFWTDIYGKQMDHLQRNTLMEVCCFVRLFVLLNINCVQGQYVLKDLRFRGLRRADGMRKEDVELQLAFACGVFRHCCHSLEFSHAW